MRVVKTLQKYLKMNSQLNLFMDSIDYKWGKKEKLKIFSTTFPATFYICKFKTRSQYIAHADIKGICYHSL